MITLTKAKLVKNEQLPGQVLSNRLKFVTMLTQSVAKELGAGWLVFEKGGAVRGGFDIVELDATFPEATVIHEVGKMSRLKLQGVTASHFRAYRLGDGKKKPKKLMLSFRVEHAGPPFELMDHMLKIGKGEGECTIEAPKQQTLPTLGPGFTDPDKDGRFPGTEPAASKKIGKTAIGHLYAVEAVGGWYWGASGQAAKQIHQNPLRMANGPMESEQAALQAGAADLTEFLEKHASKVRGAEKEAATKLAEWAQAVGNPKA